MRPAWAATMFAAAVAVGLSWCITRAPVVDMAPPDATSAFKTIQDNPLPFYAYNVAFEPTRRAYLALRLRNLTRAHPAFTKQQRVDRYIKVR